MPKHCTKVGTADVWLTLIASMVQQKNVPLGNLALWLQTIRCANQRVSDFRKVETDNSKEDNRYLGKT